MNIDRNFFSQQWYKSIAAEFGPAGQVAAIRILISIFESPKGYWRQWKLIDCYEIINEIPGLTLEQLDNIVTRMALYEVFDKNLLQYNHVLTSAYIQREFIRRYGTSRACRLTWIDYPMLKPQELLELGVIPAVHESQTDGFDQPYVKPDEPFGQKIPLPANHPLHSSGQRCRRIPYKDPKLHVYRLVKAPAQRRNTLRPPTM